MERASNLCCSIGRKLAEFATFADYLDCRQIPASKSSLIANKLDNCLIMAEVTKDEKNALM
jgi:hypothetical protein